MGAQAAKRHDAEMLDPLDFEEAQRGLIAPLPNGGEIRRQDGSVLWSLREYSFIRPGESAPQTVNPLLWRQAQLTNFGGLFRLREGMYQIRGFDLANMHLIEGESGIIVIDTLSTVDQARAALSFYFEHRPRRPITGVIYSHSHTPSYGGVKGVIEEVDVRDKRVPLIAATGFVGTIEAALAFGGAAARRRVQYHYASLVPKDERGQLDLGIGKIAPLNSHAVSLVQPNDFITRTGESRRIDGVEMTFVLANETEAPAELMIFFPRAKALFSAEVATHTQHNIYTPRGVPVRDANKWWRAIDDAIRIVDDGAELVFMHHHWPKWGKTRVNNFLTKQRALYKYIHDQTVRLINAGRTLSEVGNDLQLPPCLATESSCRGFYGTTSHNAKGIYQQYLGWFEGNPARLDPLPPVEAASKYVSFMGGAGSVLRQARESYEAGEFRWVAEVLAHVVFSDPQNEAARSLQADALEQLGYQAESGAWRNYYLAGAFELRNGIPPKPPGLVPVVSAGVVTAFSTDFYFDNLATRLNAARAEGRQIVCNWIFTDSDERYRVEVSNCVMLHHRGKQDAAPNLTIRLQRPTIDALLSGTKTYEQATADGSFDVEGDPRILEDFVSLLDDPDPMFAIMTP